MNKKLCCICQHPINNEDAPVIAMSGYGNPKCACESCEALIETAMKSHDPDEISAACKSLGEALTDGNTGDEQIIESVNNIIYSANGRCTAIKDGTYDFTLDDDVAEDEFDITDDLEETEEDRKKDERDQKFNKILDTVSAWVLGALFVVALAFFIFKVVL